MLAVPYMRRQPDHNALGSLQASRPAHPSVSRAYDRMAHALKERIIKNSLSDFRFGIWGCAGLAISFVLLIGQLTARLAFCAA